MRIKTFCKFIETEAVKDHILNDSTVVIDGQNFLYNLYKESGLQFIFGCESDKYADHVRQRLTMFKEANVKCYFFFKGGHEDISKKKNNQLKTNWHISDFVGGGEDKEIVLPIFMKDVYKQVLDEMGFDYVVCEIEAKKECIAFAQRHNCPIISFDIEYCFSGVPYIPRSTLDVEEGTNNLKCKLFKFDDFLRKFKLTGEKLAIFIVLTDEKIFPDGQFMGFIESLKIPLGNYKRNARILKWLSRTNRQVALDTIFKFNPQDKEKFLEEEAKTKEFIQRKETPGLPMEYFEHGNNLEILEKDSKWFEKGVALQHVALQFVNLYRSAMVFRSWAVVDKEADDAMLLSMDIVRYAFDLLTNFQDRELTFVVGEERVPAPALCVQRPAYEATDSVFENGWNGIRSLKLFEHFLIETLKGFPFESLEKLPEDARLLMVALVYFSRKKPVDTTNEIYSVLLSYIALNICETNDLENIKPDMSSKPILDSITDKEAINASDKVTAAAVFEQYRGRVTGEEMMRIFDVKLVHPLVEFQHCLQNLNFLNKLCGCPYRPTVYSKTYNGTFVYKMLYEINKKHSGNGLDGFIKNKLNPAATVLAFMNGLIETYEALFI